MPTQTFQLIGQIASSGRIAVARLRWNYGDGYEQAAVVGHSEGQEFVNIVFNALSDQRTTITDPEDAGVKTPFDYAVDFIMRRLVDGEAFNVTTTRNTTLLVYLEDDEISYDTVGKKVFKSGVRCRQARTS